MKFQFFGFYRPGYPGGPERPYIRVLVTLTKFESSKQVYMMIDSGSDITTLQPKDSLLMLTSKQFEKLKSKRSIETLGGLIESHLEEAFIGFFLSDKRICWVPINIDIVDPTLPSRLPSILGNDVLSFGTIVINFTRNILKIELELPNPIITNI